MQCIGFKLQLRIKFIMDKLFYHKVDEILKTKILDTDTAESATRNIAMQMWHEVDNYVAVFSLVAILCRHCPELEIMLAEMIED